jgi:hypothetical protein
MRLLHYRKAKVEQSEQDLDLHVTADVHLLMGPFVPLLTVTAA